MSTENKQDTVAEWSGEFGRDYIARNPVSKESSGQAETAFRRMLETAGITRETKSVLEVGANVGINLSALRRILPDARIAAVEPNPTACEALRQSPSKIEVHEASAYKLPFEDKSFDLVFTNGVLIHIPPDKLATAVSEICRVSKTFVLCSEYFSHKPEEIAYHGRQGLLWKRDFGSFYLDTVPGLKVRSYGFLWQRELPLFDDLNWWVFEK